MALNQQLQRIPLFKALEASDLNSLLGRLQQRRYRAGQVLFHMGDDGGTLYIICKGRVKITIPSTNGEEIILAMLSEGEFLGELSLIDGHSRSASVLAMEETDVLCLFREDFLHLLRTRFDIVLRVLKILSQRLRDTNTLLAESYFLDITARLAKKILALNQNFGINEEGTRRIGIRVTQRELAAMVGATRESVNKNLKALREKNIIEMKKGYITILDPVRLEQSVRPLDML